MHKNNIITELVYVMTSKFSYMYINSYYNKVFIFLDKMIIRIKKQESYIENKKSPNNQDNIA